VCYVGGLLLQNTLSYQHVTREALRPHIFPLTLRLSSIYDYSHLKMACFFGVKMSNQVAEMGNKSNCILVCIFGKQSTAL